MLFLRFQNRFCDSVPDSTPITILGIVSIFSLPNQTKLYDSNCKSYDFNNFGCCYLAAEIMCQFYSFKVTCCLLLWSYLFYLCEIMFEVAHLCKVVYLFSNFSSWLEYVASLGVYHSLPYALKWYSSYEMIEPLCVGIHYHLCIPVLNKWACTEKSLLSQCPHPPH